MFEDYPKTRPALPRHIAEVYSATYKSNRKGDTVASEAAQRMESWLHKKVAEDVVGYNGPPRATLELGAGTLNQLPYEPDVGQYDIVEPLPGPVPGVTAHFEEKKRVVRHLRDSERLTV